MAKVLLHGLAIVLLLNGGPSWAVAEQGEQQRPRRLLSLKYLWSSVRPHLLRVQPTLLLCQRVKGLKRAFAKGVPREERQGTLDRACLDLLGTLSTQFDKITNIPWSQREQIARGTMGALKLAIDGQLQVHHLELVLSTLVTQLALSPKDHSKEIEEVFARPLRKLLTTAAGRTPPLDQQYLEHLSLALLAVFPTSGEE